MKNIGIIGGGLIGSSWAAIFSRSEERRVGKECER